MFFIPENRLRHIFRQSPGHLADTPANREALLEMVADPNNLAGYDRRGHAWYAAERGDGSQLWAIVRGNQIVNGGLNPKARRFNPRSGMSNPEKST